MRKLTRRLLKKSNASFLLALELFNKPTIEYRAEAFSILFTNAWELLLKAYIYEQSGGRKLSIFRRKKPRQKRESITIDECISEVFSNDNDPVKRNVEYISEIRNEAVHLIINELDPYFSRVFQSGVINYMDYLYKWFGISMDEQLKSGLISLVSDREKILNPALLKGRYNKEDIFSILGWVQKFKDLKKLGEKATLSLTHTVAIIRNPKKADFVLSAGQKGQRFALVLEKTKDYDQTHPYNRTSAMKEIESRLRRGIKFTTYDFTAYCFVRRIRKTNKNDYYWKGKYSGSGQYSSKLIEELVTAVNANPRDLEKWRSRYSQRRKRLMRRKKTE